MIFSPFKYTVTFPFNTPAISYTLFLNKANISSVKPSNENLL